MHKYSHPCLHYSRGQSRGKFVILLNKRGSYFKKVAHSSLQFVKRKTISCFPQKSPRVEAVGWEALVAQVQQIQVVTSGSFGW